jgi:hypothetical protein
MGRSVRACPWPATRTRVHDIVGADADGAVEFLDGPGLAEAADPRSPVRWVPGHRSGLPENSRETDVRPLVVDRRHVVGGGAAACRSLRRVLAARSVDPLPHAEDQEEPEDPHRHDGGDGAAGGGGGHGSGPGTSRVRPGGARTGGRVRTGDGHHRARPRGAAGHSPAIRAPVSGRAGCGPRPRAWLPARRGGPTARRDVRRTGAQELDRSRVSRRTSASRATDEFRARAGSTPRPPHRRSSPRLTERRRHVAVTGPVHPPPGVPTPPPGTELKPPAPQGARP